MQFNANLFECVFFFFLINDCIIRWINTFFLKYFFFVVIYLKM